MAVAGITMEESAFKRAPRWPCVARSTVTSFCSAVPFGNREPLSNVSSPENRRRRRRKIREAMTKKSKNNTIKYDTSKVSCG